MAYDPVRDEILVPAYHAFGILTFRGDANGDVPPVRKIAGPKTQLVWPNAVALDAVHGEIFVPNQRKVFVFPRDANGDVAPIRILDGPDTGFAAGIDRVTIDPVHNLMMVSSAGGIRIFDRMANGNTKPIRFIKFDGDVRLMTTYPEKGTIFAVVRVGENSGEDIAGRFELNDYVAVYSVFDDGEVAPRLTIGGPNNVLKDPRGIAIDIKNKNVMVSDKTQNAVFTFNVPEAF